MPSPRTLTPIGYNWLTRHFEVDPIPHHVESYLARPGVRIREDHGGKSREIYPHTAIRLESVFDHLEFALKREGLHLQLLRMILPRIPAQEITAYVRSKPTGANHRRLWYFYERFSEKRLPIPDVPVGNYVNLLDPRLYFTGPVQKYRRWRINRNLLHTIHFSPILRRTAALHPARDTALNERCAEIS